MWRIGEFSRGADIEGSTGSGEVSEFHVRMQARERVASLPEPGPQDTTLPVDVTAAKAYPLL